MSMNDPACASDSILEECVAGKDSVHTAASLYHCKVMVLCWEDHL